MNPDDLKKIQETVSSQIELSVNGSIRDLDKKLDQHIIDDEVRAKKLDTHIDDFNNFKEGAKGAVALGNNIRGFGIITASIIGIVAGGAEIIHLIVDIFKK